MTRRRDALNADRRRLPMVEVTKPVFKLYRAMLETDYPHLLD